MDTLQLSSHRGLRFLVWIAIIILPILFVGVPQGAQAEGNEPTATIAPTIIYTLPPTDTPIPTEASQEGAAPEEDNAVTAKDLDESQMDNAAPEAPQEDESGPQPWLSSLGTVNLCLIGLIVIAMIAVMVIVVYGIMQRVGG